MDSSLQNVQAVADDRNSAVATHQEAEGVENEEHHIHLPNPSLWPLILGVAVLVAVMGLLFIPDNPWLTIVGAVFILVGILGWGLENPNAHRDRFIVYQEKSGRRLRFVNGQDVVDKDGHWIGLVRARFPHYILVDNGGMAVNAYYVPQRFTEEKIENGVVRLTVSESDLRAMSANVVPDDLYDATEDPGVPEVTGVPMFASAPVSPAQTGHYNYGPNYPGINTDASGSYQRSDVTVRPQSFIAERRKKVYKSPPPEVAAQN